MPLLPQKANTEGNNETQGDFTALPAGEYVAQIVKSEFKDTKAKTGKYLQLQFKVISGPEGVSCKGRVLFERLNLVNPNPIAVEIANKSLNSICVACGKAGVEDSDELHGIPMKITLKVEDATPNYPASNGFTGFHSLEEGGAATAATGDGKLPWESGDEE